MFVVTALFSIFAYLWLLVVLVLITPDFVDLWEAIVTFLFFPLLVVIAYMTDKDYCSKKEAEGAEIGEFGIGESGLFLEISSGGGGGGVVGVVVVAVRENEVTFDLNCKFLRVQVDWGGWWWWSGGSCRVVVMVVSSDLNCKLILVDVGWGGGEGCWLWWKDCISLSSFKSHLKTFLFSQYFS